MSWQSYVWFSRKINSPAGRKKWGFNHSKPAERFPRATRDLTARYNRSIMGTHQSSESGILSNSHGPHLFCWQIGGDRGVIPNLVGTVPSVPTIWWGPCFNAHNSPIYDLSSVFNLLCASSLPRGSCFIALRCHRMIKTSKRIIKC